MKAQVYRLRKIHQRRQLVRLLHVVVVVHDVWWVLRSLLDGHQDGILAEEAALLFLVRDIEEGNLETATVFEDKDTVRGHQSVAILDLFL